MPLSEHEQRLLEQMERALYAEDPKFATTLRGADARAHHRRRALLAGVVFLGGIGVLMAGAITQTPVLGVAGFVVMLGSAWYAITSWRRIPGAEAASSSTPGATGTVSAPKRSKGRASSGGFMNRMEERWRRRRDEMGR